MHAVHWCDFVLDETPSELQLRILKCMIWMNLVRLLGKMPPKMLQNRGLHNLHRTGTLFDQICADLLRFTQAHPFSPLIFQN